MSAAIRPPTPIGPLRGVLYVVSCNTLSERSTIVKAIGYSVTEELKQLVKLGFVRITKSERRDGTPTTLYTITSLGADALDAGEPVQTSAPVVVQRPKDTPDSPPSVAGARASVMDGPNYQGHELRPFAMRGGAMDAFALPSRFGNELRFPDGRVTHVDATNHPIAA